MVFLKGKNMDKVVAGPRRGKTLSGSRKESKGITVGAAEGRGSQGAVKDHTPKTQPGSGYVL